MSSTAARRVLSVALVVLVAGHVLPVPGDADWMLLGFLPWDLGYYLLWMLAAAIVVVWMTGPAWPDEPPPPLPSDGPSAPRAEPPAPRAEGDDP